MIISTSVETLDGSWIYCYTGCILGRAPQTKETLPDFCENMDPDKWDNSVVSGHPKSTRIPQVDWLSTGPPSFGASQLGIRA